MELQKGQRVWFDDDKKSYKVREANDMFAICTKPYNFKPKCVVYTIVDFERGVRGTDNLVFGLYDYYSDEDCKRAFNELNNGGLGVSRRNYVELRIAKIAAISL